MTSNLHTWTAAHVNASGDAIGEVLQFEGDRAFCRITTTSFQTQYVWLPLSSVVVTCHTPWVPASTLRRAARLAASSAV